MDLFYAFLISNSSLKEYNLKSGEEKGWNLNIGQKQKRSIGKP